MADSALISDFLEQQALKIVEDATKGQKAVAARRIRRGEIIQSIQPFFGFPVRPGEDSADASDDAKAQVPVQLEDRCTH
ncbi:hypothetical protein LPJ56_006121, partial [Coemansia sp. RSA 2599]